MTIELKPEQQRVAEVIAAHIEIGFTQAERGELIDGDMAIEMLRRRRSATLLRDAKSSARPAVRGGL